MPSQPYRSGRSRSQRSSRLQVSYWFLTPSQPYRSYQGNQGHKGVQGHKVCTCWSISCLHPGGWHGRWWWKESEEWGANHKSCCHDGWCAWGFDPGWWWGGGGGEEGEGGAGSRGNVEHEGAVQIMGLTSTLCGWQMQYSVPQLAASTSFHTNTAVTNNATCTWGPATRAPITGGNVCAVPYSPTPHGI